MTFNEKIKQLLEDFNIAPKTVWANRGTSQGMTSMLGDSPESGFGSTPNIQASGKLLPNKKDIEKDKREAKRKKLIPKEKQSKNRFRIQ